MLNRHLNDKVELRGYLIGKEKALVGAFCGHYEISRNLVYSSIPQLGWELGEGGAGGRGGLQHQAEQQRQHPGNTAWIQELWSQALPTGKQQTI